MPVVLAFDTAGSACSVAVGRDRCARVRSAEMRHGHAEALLPMIDRAMAAAGLAAAEHRCRRGLDRSRRVYRHSRRACRRAGFGAGNRRKADRRQQLRGGRRTRRRRPIRPLLVALDSRRADPYVQLFDPTGAPPASRRQFCRNACAAHIGRLDRRRSPAHCWRCGGGALATALAGWIASRYCRARPPTRAACSRPRSTRSRRAVESSAAPALPAPA